MNEMPFGKDLTAHNADECCAWTNAAGLKTRKVMDLKKFQVHCGVITLKGKNLKGKKLGAKNK